MTTTATAPQPTATTKKAPAKKAASKPRAAKKTARRATSKQRTDDEVAKDIARRLLAARAAGIIRPKLAELIGIKQSAVWRCEQGRAFTPEVGPVVAVLDRIDKGDIKPPERPSRGPSRADLQHRIDTADDMLTNTNGAKTAEALLALVRQVRDVLSAAQH